MAKRKAPSRKRPTRRKPRRSTTTPRRKRPAKKAAPTARRRTADRTAPAPRGGAPAAGSPGRHLKLPRPKPAVSRPPHRPSHAAHEPRRPQARSRRRRFNLTALSAERRRAVDALLVRVYRHAARELAELERQRVIELRRRDQELARTYAEARAELMQRLAQWERHRAGGPEPDGHPPR